jgi:hypothetical protein
MKLYRYIDKTASPRNRSEERRAATRLARKQFPDADEVNTGLRFEGLRVYVEVWRVWEDTGKREGRLYDFHPEP